MAQTTIKNSWSLMTFARIHGSMKVGKFTNKETGEIFKSCIFLKDGNSLFVAFSSNLGELTPREIAQRKEDLQVVLLDSGNYYLCRQGNPDEAWENVDLGL